MTITENENARCPYCGSPVREMPRYISPAEAERRARQLAEIEAGIRKRIEEGVQRAKVGGGEKR